MKDLPERDDDLAQWCRDAFVAKVCHSFLLMFYFIFFSENILTYIYIYVSN